MILFQGPCPPPWMATFSLCLQWSSCVRPNLSPKDTSHLELEPTHMTLSHLNYLFKDPISKYSPILRYWGIGLQHISLAHNTSGNGPRARLSSEHLSFRSAPVTAFSCPYLSSSPHPHPTPVLTTAILDRTQTMSYMQPAG